MNYYIDGPTLPWLWPGLALVGLGMQLASIWLKQYWLLAFGGFSIIIDAYIERDITLFASDCLAALVIAAIIYSYKKNNSS